MLSPLARKADAADPVARIAGFMRGFSLEATRPTPTDIDELRAAAPQGTQIYLSALPKRSFEEAASHAVAVRQAGFEPVPHLAARSIDSRAMLDDFLALAAAQAQVRRVLVIAGDQDKAPGPFSDARDLIESGLLQKHGITEIGISGYPEGHPRIRLETLDRAVAAKVESAEQSGLKVTIVTQFGFDPQTIVRWVLRLRDLGFEQPLRIGMAGPTDLTTLLRFAARCGVRASAGSAARNAGLVRKLFAVSTPDTVVRALAESSGLGEIAAHFFSFGGLGASARWAAAVAAGEITLDGEGFSVEVR
jgi:methylenetetrahydrofolate reductase (NADPH)